MPFDFVLGISDNLDSDHNGTSRPSPASVEAWAARRHAGVPAAAAAAGRCAVRADNDTPDGKSFYRGPGGTPQPGSLDHVCSCTHGFGFSTTTTGAQPIHPQTSPTTTGEVQWVPRGLPELLHPVSTNLQPPTQFLPDRRRQGGIHHHPRIGELPLGVLSSPAPSRRGVSCRRCTTSSIAPRPNTLQVDRS